MQHVFKISKTLNRFFYALIFLTLLSCSGDHRNGSYTIGVDEAWYGSDFMGQQNSVTGFARDLLREIGKNKKMKLSLLSVNWDSLIPDLKKDGRYQGILSALTPYIFNQSTFDFSQPFLMTGPVLILPVNSPWKSIDQLGGKEIAFLAHSDGALLLEKNPGILIRPYESIAQALNDVVSGAVDGAIVDVIIASSYSQNIYAGQLKIVTAPLNEQGLRLLTRTNENPQLIHAFNEGLDELKHNGTYEALLKKWSLGQGSK